MSVGELQQELDKCRAALEETRLRLDMILGSIPGGVLVFDADSGLIDYIGDGILQIFQCTERDFRLYYRNCFDNLVLD